MQNFKISLNMMKFFNARVLTSENNDGQLEEGIFIPIKDNNILRSKSGYYLNLFLPQVDIPNRLGSTHTVHIYTSKRFRTKVSKMGKVFTPVLGYMNPSIARTMEQKYAELYRENKTNSKVYLNLNKDK